MRKPIEKDTVRSSGGVLQVPRARMWDAMSRLTRTAGEFGIAHIEDAAHPIDEATVSDYIEALVAAGFVEQVRGQARTGQGQFGRAAWRVVKACATAPRVSKAGVLSTQGLGVLAMWRSAKVLKKFKPSELALAATSGGVTVHKQTARKWCQMLAHSGHFKYLSKGKGGIESVFMLVNDTGPHAPAITRAKVVFDRNTGALHVTDTAEEVAHALDR